MKTTIELPDALLSAAKAVAARRGTTFKAMMEHALRREIFEEKPARHAIFKLNEHGFPVLKKRKAAVVTSKMVYQMMGET